MPREKVLNKKDLSHNPVDLTDTPVKISGYGDPIATLTSWAPEIVECADFQSHNPAQADSNRLEFRASMQAILNDMIIVEVSGQGEGGDTADSSAFFRGASGRGSSRRRRARSATSYTERRA